MARCARDLAALKREVQALEHELASLGTPQPGPTVPPKTTSDRAPPSRRAASKVSATSTAAKPSPRSQFSGEALKAHRERLGLSGDNYGKLLGASGVSIYNWEQGKTRPLKSSVDAWTAIRSIGKPAKPPNVWRASRPLSPNRSPSRHRPRSSLRTPAVQPPRGVLRALHRVVCGRGRNPTLTRQHPAQRRADSRNRPLITHATCCSLSRSSRLKKWTPRIGQCGK